MSKKPRANPIAEAAGRNPSVVIQAFCPETEYTLDLDGCILLEALQSPFLTGGAPGIRDTLLASLVLTDADAVLRARRNNRIDDLIRDASRGRRPADLIALGTKISAAIAAAFAPLQTGTEPAEKKSSLAPAGGSP